MYAGARAHTHETTTPGRMVVALASRDARCFPSRPTTQEPHCNGNALAGGHGDGGGWLLMHAHGVRKTGLTQLHIRQTIYCVMRHTPNWSWQSGASVNGPISHGTSGGFRAQFSYIFSRASIMVTACTPPPERVSRSPRPSVRRTLNVVARQRKTAIVCVAADRARLVLCYTEGWLYVYAVHEACSSHIYSHIYHLCAVPGAAKRGLCTC